MQRSTNKIAFNTFYFKAYILATHHPVTCVYYLITCVSECYKIIPKVWFHLLALVKDFGPIYFLGGIEGLACLRWEINGWLEWTLCHDLKNKYEHYRPYKINSNRAGFLARVLFLFSEDCRAAWVVRGSQPEHERVFKELRSDMHYPLAFGDKTKMIQISLHTENPCTMRRRNTV